MKTKKFNPYEPLDEEEKELINSIEHGELKSVKNLTKVKKWAKQIATNTLRKDSRITIRIASNDLIRLKEEAAYKGLPYQTFIASVLHEHAAGHYQPVSRNSTNN